MGAQTVPIGNYIVNLRKTKMDSKPTILFAGEYVHRILMLDHVEDPPDLVYRGESLTEPAGSVLVGFYGGTRDGMVSCMPSECDTWIEPNGEVYA